jgi:hypothetical protein
MSSNSYFFTFRCWSIEVGTACASVSPANWNSCNSVIPGEVSTDRTMNCFAFTRSIGTQWKETTSFLGIGALPSYTYVQASPRCIAASSCTNRYSPFRVTPWRTTARSKLVTALCFRAVFDALVSHDTEPIIKAQSTITKNATLFMTSPVWGSSSKLNHLHSNGTRTCSMRRALKNKTRTSGTIFAMIVPAKERRICWNFSSQWALLPNRLRNFTQTVNDERRLIG